MAEQFLQRGVSLLVEADISEPMLTTAIRRISSKFDLAQFYRAVQMHAGFHSWKTRSILYSAGVGYVLA